MFKRLNLPPGINRESTEYSAEGTWFDSNNIRFRGMYPECIGGWEQEGSFTLDGIGREIFSWSTYSGYQYICVATSWKFYVIHACVAYDITPLRVAPVTLASDPFTATNGSSTITVAAAGHGASVGDFVTFSGAASLGGAITVDVLNREYQIVSITLNTFTFVATATANSSDTAKGGASVVASYQISIGNSAPVSGSGWGLSVWGGSAPADGNSAIITGISNASPAVVTATNEFENGDSVYISGVSGITNTTSTFTAIAKAAQTQIIAANALVDGDLIHITGVDGMTQLNDNYYVVSDSSGANFKIKHRNLEYVDSREYTTYSGPSGTAEVSLNGKHYTVSDRTTTTFQIKDSSGTKINTPAAVPGWSAYSAPNTGTADTGRGWGDPADLSVVISDGIRLCYVDNYGEDLMIANKNGEIYYWDVSSATTVSTGIPKSDGTERALPIDNDVAFEGNSGTPEVIGSFLVSDRDGHVVAFQCNDIGASAKNSLLVRWSDQNNPFEWTPSATNTSGGQILRIGSRIVGGLVGREEILVWTDSAMYSMRYVGYPAMFSFSVVSGNVRIISSRSAVNVSSMIFFMGDDGFYSYAGALAPLASTVEKYVFDDINMDESEKIFAGANSVFNEVFWIYPSIGSIEPDKYVLYNYLDQVWSIGNFDMSSLSLESTSTSSYNRTSWMDASIFGSPMATYIHQWDSTTTPSTQKTAVMMQEMGSSAQGGDMNSFVESGDMEISEGDRYALLNRIFPDVKFFDIAETAADPSLSISVSAKDFPGSAQLSISTVDVKHSMTTGLNGVGSVPPSGNATAIRGRGRAMSVKFSSDASNYKWRLGDTRIDMRPDGRR